MDYRDRLPLSIRRFTVGRWPWLWLGLGCAAALMGQAAPALLDEADLRERISLQRSLVEKQETLVAQAPAEEARREALVAWWHGSAEARFRGANIAAAAAKAQDHVRAAFARPGLRLEKVETARLEPLTEYPAGSLVAMTISVLADRMEPLAEALAALESAGETTPAPWLRVGNLSVLATGVRFVTGVKLEATVYALAEGDAG